MPVSFQRRGVSSRDPSTISIHPIFIHDFDFHDINFLSDAWPTIHSVWDENWRTIGELEEGRKRKPNQRILRKKENVYLG